VSLGATLGRSLLDVLARPSTWPLALVGFLVRGGWLLIIAPVVVVPTPVGLANVIAPFLEDVAFGRRTGEVIAISVVAALLVVAWLVGGGLVAAVAEAEGVRRVAAEEDVDLPERTVALRILAARLIALMPFALGIVWGAVRLVALAYRELTVPSDVAVPVVWRVLAGAPEAVVVLLLTFLGSEMLGAVASRRIVVTGQSPLSALRSGGGRLYRHLGRMLGIALATNGVLLAVLLSTGLAATAMWGALGDALDMGEASVLTTVLLIGFVAIFLGGLVLIGLACAWRAAVWTVDMAGTFGGVGASRSSD
jgi:hypothetical protein